MNTKLIFLILLLLSATEIFFNAFTIAINFILSIFNANVELGEKPKTAIKLIVVAIFFTSVIFFLMQLFIYLANLLGISLNESFLDIF